MSLSLRSEYTGARAGVRDGQETVVMILCTDVYSTVQCSTVQYRDAEREQEMATSGQTDFKIQIINKLK